ncbi:uncharacterized protein LOC8065211 isoform X2 [Sorghum bicolor]|uniref:Uncharacterized protein n=1 Tax=Sorghum bicolor TaxID=4558 RepID=A0A1Z5S744_SORBI|nr:uncharacterized protein LOC8065211 isoform X2 [Sorghum bicolor]OQU91555.1 hypothetical protein SORBI_3001G204100 [Sorghum bicolor]|eukprot:XP_021315794.1 uncharacterized protein LOC8065211 isoform X2 [Sorghum bicolor]
MASSALRRSIPRCTSLRHSIPPHLPPAAAGAFRRSFQSGDGGETVEEFDERLFGSKGTEEGSLYARLDRAENASRRYGMGSGIGGFAGLGDRKSSGSSMGRFPGFNDRSGSGSAMGGFGALSDKSRSGSIGLYDSSNDSINQTLGNVARFQTDDDNNEDDEWEEEDFDFRPDVTYRRGSTYSVRDLDLTRPAAAKNPPRPQFETTTAEVLRKADFRGPTNHLNSLDSPNFYKVTEREFNRREKEHRATVPTITQPANSTKASRKPIFKFLKRTSELFKWKHLPVHLNPHLAAILTSRHPSSDASGSGLQSVTWCSLHLQVAPCQLHNGPAHRCNPT